MFNNDNFILTANSYFSSSKTAKLVVITIYFYKLFKISLLCYEKFINLILILGDNLLLKIAVIFYFKMKSFSYSSIDYSSSSLLLDYSSYSNLMKLNKFINNFKSLFLYNMPPNLYIFQFFFKLYFFKKQKYYKNFKDILSSKSCFNIS